MHINNFQIISLQNKNKRAIKLKTLNQITRKLRKKYQLKTTDELVT